MMRCLPLAVTAVLLLGTCGPAHIGPRAVPGKPDAPSQPVAKGYLVTERPPNEPVVVDTDGKPLKPKVTADFAGVPQTNDWWSSLIWQRDPKNPYSYNMFPHPLAMRAYAEGLAMNYPSEPVIKGRDYMYPFEQDFVVGLEGLKAPDTRVAAYSDWAVTAEWRSGDEHLRATFGHGMPFVYFTKAGPAGAAVTIAAAKADKVEVWREGAGAVGFTVAGNRHYGLFAPSKATWKRDGAVFRSDLGGKDYFSVAVLPDRKPQTLDVYRRHAYAFVKDTRATWSYDEAAATLTTTFSVETELKDDQKGLASVPLLALYRHQWINTAAPLLAYKYESPRGAMKVLAAKSFTTSMKFGGVLPLLPDSGKYNRDDLASYVNKIYREPDHFPVGLSPKPDRDTYWVGKSFGKLAPVIQIADALGEEEVRDQLLQATQNELQNWFDGRPPGMFYYDKTWRTLIGMPQSYESGAAMNDHHFHYGYYVMAAAVVARYRPEWAKEWAPFVDLLIKDAANWDRKDDKFPFLRSMDVYAGHSWANGPGQYEEGNNQESSSEEINFSTSVILWGALTGNKAIRDLGIFLYTNQVETVEQSWFDIDKKVVPKGFDHPTVGIVWGAGGRYDTWFDQQPIMIHGINMLPFHGGSLYLGRHPEYVKLNYDLMTKRSGGLVYTWRDYALMFLALTDAKQAAALFQEDRYFLPEFGNTMAWTYYWIANLAAFGRPDTGVTADIPTYAVFKKGKARTYAAFNPGGQARTVKFSDGFKLEVPPRELARGERPGD
jgi:endoglucanase Acf2